MFRKEMTLQIEASNMRRSRIPSQSSVVLVRSMQFVLLLEPSMPWCGLLIASLRNNHSLLQNKIPVLNVIFIEFQLAFHADELVHLELALLVLELDFADGLRAGRAAKEALA